MFAKGHNLCARPAGMQLSVEDRCHVARPRNLYRLDKAVANNADSIRFAQIKLRKMPAISITN